MNILKYYACHGLITDPGEFTMLYRHLPPNIDEIAILIHNITIHFQYLQENGGRNVISRINEIFIRKISDRIRKLQELGVTHIADELPYVKKTICTCRDYALLLCSMLRHIGVPARIRYGFAQYLDYDPSFFFDHTIVEYWDGKCWKLSERYLTENIKDRFNIFFPHYDVPRDKFIMAHDAWLLYRKGVLDANKFGNGYVKRRSGPWYIRNKLIQDLASINKMEMQPFDLWGYMVDRNLKQIFRHFMLPDEEALMDRIATYLSNIDRDFMSLQHIYKADPLLQVGAEVYVVRMSGRYIIENIT